MLSFINQSAIRSDFVFFFPHEFLRGSEMYLYLFKKKEKQ